MARLTTDEMLAIREVSRLKSPAEKHRHKTLDVMHKLNGVGEGTCADCRHLYDMPIDGAIRHAFKCRRFRVSSSEATDWRKSWPACGAKVASADA